MLINPASYIKTEEEIGIMREAGKILAQILAEIESMIKPDIDVWELEQKFISLCEKHGVEPACKNYSPHGMPPFPTGLCVSINDQSVHCYPQKGTVLKEGDVVTVDTDIKHKGLYVDSAFSKGVGKISPQNQELIETTEKALNRAIKKVKSGVKIGTISSTIQKTVQKAGFDVIRDYAGHGIGKTMHEYPEIPCFGNKNEGPKLKSGMTICIEPLVCMGDPEIRHPNHWETQMADGKVFAQFEHTVLVTNKGYEILTGR